MISINDTKTTKNMSATALSNDLRTVLAKIARNEPLTELERIIAWEATKSTEYDEVSRWKHAFREFNQLCTDATLPPAEPVRGGIKCWHGADELVCTAMDEGGYGYFQHPTNGSVQRLHSDELTTRSPFGNFVKLRDLPVGSTFYWKDSTHWRPLQLMSFREDSVCTLPTRGGNVFIPNDFLDKLVSYFPPEWCGQGWSLNPFTRELYIKIPSGVKTAASELRTKNQTQIEAHVNRLWTTYPGLYYAFQFLKNGSDFVFRIPHFEYTVWTSAETWAPAYCWTRTQAIPDGAIPACWKHSYCSAKHIGASKTRCGWYMTPDGVRFTGTNWKLMYGAERVHVVLLKQFTFNDVSVSFETDADLQAFEDAYTTNSNDYMGTMPAMRVQTEMCAAVSTA